MKESTRQLKRRADQLVKSHLKLMDELVAIRKKNGISQEVVGQRMGITQPGVAAIEAYDANPTLSSIRRYALAIGARIEHVVIEDSDSHLQLKPSRTRIPS